MQLVAGKQPELALWRDPPHPPRLPLQISLAVACLDDLPAPAPQAANPTDCIDGCRVLGSPSVPLRFPKAHGSGPSECVSHGSVAGSEQGPVGIGDARSQAGAGAAAGGEGRPRGGALLQVGARREEAAQPRRRKLLLPLLQAAAARPSRGRGLCTPPARGRGLCTPPAPGTPAASPNVQLLHDAAA